MIQLWKVDITTTLPNVKLVDEYLRNCSIGKKTVSKKGKTTTVLYTDVIIPRKIPSNKIIAYAATPLMRLDNFTTKGTIKGFTSFDSQAIITNAIYGDTNLKLYGTGTSKEYVVKTLKDSKYKMELDIKSMEEVDSIDGIVFGVSKTSTSNNKAASVDKKKLAAKAPKTGKTVKKAVSKKVSKTKDTKDKTKSVKGINKAELAAKMKNRKK